MLSPPAGEIVFELGAFRVGEEAMFHLGPIFSDHSEAETAGGIFIAHSSKSLLD